VGEGGKTRYAEESTEKVQKNLTFDVKGDQGSRRGKWGREKHISKLSRGKGVERHLSTRRASLCESVEKKREKRRKLTGGGERKRRGS